MAGGAIRGWAPADETAVLSLNEVAIPAVTPMTSADFGYYHRIAEQFVVTAGIVRGISGFLILIGPGVDDYESPNYRWFSERYDNFCYVDRIVVDERHRGTGLGRRLYEFAIETAADRPLLAEVNTRPRNDLSLAFHERMGFDHVGSQQAEGGAKEVAMLRRQAESGP